MRRRRWKASEAGLILLVLFVGVLVAGFLRNSAPDTGQVVTVPAYTPTPADRAPAPPEPADDADSETLIVARVIDGDTIEVEDKGSVRDVRILGMDTPETKHPTKGVQCFGPEASAQTKKLLPLRSQVVLHFEGERQDRFGRLLAYVEHDGADLSAELVGGGYARAYPVGHDYAVQRTPSYVQLQAKAKQAKLGLWGACS